MKRLLTFTALYLATLYIVTEFVDEHVGWLVSLGPVERFGRRCGW